MIMPAMVYKADTARPLSWFRTVGGATGLPWMLYNNPVAYPVDITPELFAELADVKNLVAIKESSGNTRRITELRNVGRRPLRHLHRRGRSHAGERDPRDRRLGGRVRASRSRARTSTSGS